MKVAVIAADGRSGRAIVAELLEHGYDVVAGVRGFARLADHRQLDVRQCDGTSLEDVRSLLHGCDAAVSAVGHVRGSRRDVQTATMMNIVRAARRENVRRVVSLTGTGVRFPGDRRGLLDQLLSSGVRLVDPARVQDGIDHAEVLKASDLDWTLLRVVKLTNWPAGQFSLKANGPGKVLVPRGEVARAVRQVLESAAYIRQAPIISPASPHSTV